MAPRRTDVPRGGSSRGGDRGGFLNLFPGIISDAAPHDTVTFFILIIFTSQLHSEGEQVLPVDMTQLFWCLIDEG